MPQCYYVVFSIHLYLHYDLCLSYRENSGDSATDDDDVLEWTQPMKEESQGPPAETIEKVLKRRVGRKMGTWKREKVNWWGKYIHV